MTIESLLAIIGYTVAIFSFGYMIGKTLTKSDNRPSRQTERLSRTLTRANCSRV